MRGPTFAPIDLKTLRRHCELHALTYLVNLILHNKVKDNVFHDYLSEQD